MPNNQNLNVSYGGKVAADTISVTVKNYVKEIILTTPNKTIYKYGDAIDLTGGSYNVKYGGPGRAVGPAGREKRKIE